MDFDTYIQWKHVISLHSTYISESEKRHGTPPNRGKQSKSAQKRKTQRTYGTDTAVGINVSMHQMYKSINLQITSNNEKTGGGETTRGADADAGAVVLIWVEFTCIYVDKKKTSWNRY